MLPPKIKNSFNFQPRNPSNLKNSSVINFKSSVQHEARKTNMDIFMLGQKIRADEIFKYVNKRMFKPF